MFGANESEIPECFPVESEDERARDSVVYLDNASTPKQRGSGMKQSVSQEVRKQAL
jgi:hypothetical protein